MLAVMKAQASKSVSPRGYVPVEEGWIHVDGELECDIDTARRHRHPIPVETDIHHSPTHTIHYNRVALCSCSFYRNAYNILRIIMLIITALFICICSLYGFGQILSLQLDDYFCEPKSLEEIHEHSLQNNLNEGTDEGCFTTSNNKVDEEKLFYVGSYIAYQSIWSLTRENITKCALFMIIAFFLIIVFIIYMVEICTDCSRFWRRNWHRVTLPNQTQSNGICNQIMTSQFMIRLLELKRTYYDDHFSMHSTYWVIKMTIRESIEILIQCTVFLQYGGAQMSFLYVFHSSNKLIAAESKSSVMLFALFLCVNCILTGLLWIMYLCKKNISFLNKGKLFGYIAFLIDAIFDTFYSIFPLMLLGDNISFRTAAAVLNSNSLITFLSVYYPLLFLSLKICLILSHCTAMSRIEWTHSHIAVPTQDMEQDTQHIQIFESKNRCFLCCKMTFDGSYLNYDITNAYGDHKYCGYIVQVIRRLSLGVWSVLLIAIGISIIMLSLYHFNEMEYLCDNPNDEEIIKHPELLVWDNCNYKVYPFFNDNGCNCRGFVMHKHDINNNEAVLANHSVIESLLEHWWMLEVFKYEVFNLITIVNLTSKQLQSKNMRVFHMDQISIKYIDDIIGINWKNVEYLTFKATFIKNSDFVIPNSTSLLQNIQYLDLSYNLYFEDEMIDIICNLKNLRVLTLTFSTISQIPYCLKEFKQLKYIDVTGSNGEILDIGLLALPNLNEFLFLNSELTEHSFIGYNDNNTKIFEYNAETVFGWQGSQLCWNFYGTSDIIYNGTQTIWSAVKDVYYPYLWHFLNETKSCEYYCKYNTFLDFGPGICFASQWNNGICDENCNTLNCEYDGGDCNQLCNCDITLLMNNQCDVECNTTECNYDQFECVSDAVVIDNYYSMDNYTECIETTRCKREWIGDHVCDEYCRVNVCDFDKGDCLMCDGTCKSLWEEYFLFFANSIIVDYQIDEEEACTKLWPAVEKVSNQAHSIFVYYNCSTFIPLFDYDGNGKLSGNEMIDVALIVSGEYDRIKEVNCSICADSVQQYMHGE